MFQPEGEVDSVKGSCFGLGRGFLAEGVRALAAELRSRGDERGWLSLCPGDLFTPLKWEDISASLAAFATRAIARRACGQNALN